MAIVLLVLLRELFINHVALHRPGPQEVSSLYFHVKLSVVRGAVFAVEISSSSKFWVLTHVASWGTVAQVRSHENTV